jgi:4-amino-4-deoxy-L-arabinose transferase-like glycosyltransferase
LKYAAYLFLLITSVFILNLRLDVMEIDAAQYASISLEMLQSGSYLEVFDQGKDYLDKPPILFWMSALSMKIFGVSNFAYKLPALLILLLGVYALFQLALYWYNQETALLAALLLCFNNAWLLMTNDVRTDGVLSGFIVFAVWQLISFHKNGKWINLLGASIGIAGAMMAKGPIGLVIIAMAVGTPWLLAKDWKAIFKWQWNFLIFLVAVLLAPMLYGLYTQYDLHPEKEVYGLKGPSGILFFFYTQSFGRITGDIYWDNHAPWHYFFDTMAWDMQPWFHIFLLAFIIRLVEMVKARFRFDPNTDYVSFFGFLLPLMALSASRFKLPHYVFPIFPFAALISADFIVNKLPQYTTTFKGLKIFQGVLSVLLLSAIAVAFSFFFTPSYLQLTIYLLGLMAFILVWYQSTYFKLKWYQAHLFAFGVFGLMMSVYFYPNLLQYQFSSQMGKDIAQNKYPIKEVYRFGIFDRSFGFYTENKIPLIDKNQIPQMSKGSVLAVTAASLAELDTLVQTEFDTLATYHAYPVTQISPEFLLKHLREQKLQKAYLMIKK